MSSICRHGRLRLARGAAVMLPICASRSMMTTSSRQRVSPERETCGYSLAATRSLATRFRVTRCGGWFMSERREVVVGSVLQAHQLQQYLHSASVEFTALPMEYRDGVARWPFI